MRTFPQNEPPDGCVNLSDGETSDTIYSAYSRHGKLLGHTTSLVRAKNWKDTAYVLRPDGTQAWPNPTKG